MSGMKRDLISSTSNWSSLLIQLVFINITLKFAYIYIYELFSYCVISTSKIVYPKLKFWCPFSKREQSNEKEIASLVLEYPLQCTLKLHEFILFMIKGAVGEEQRVFPLRRS